MTWREASVFARAGIPVRRAAWQTASTTYGSRLVYVSGAGTTRAVAIRILNGAENVASAAIFGTPEWQAEDWELAK